MDGSVEDVVRPGSGAVQWRRLELVRAGWGLVVLTRPRPVLSATSTGADQTMVVVGRVLGARHVTQAVLSGARPSPDVLAMGVWVDAVHALCALGLAAASRRRTGAGVGDALASLGWAVVGYRDLVTPRTVVPDNTRRRDAMARWTLARVPAGARLRRLAERERSRCGLGG